MAAKLGHDRVYAIDWHNLQRPIGWDEAITFAKEHDQQELLGGFGDAQEAETESPRISVRDMLLEGGDLKGILADNHKVYMDLARIGEGANYIGADVILRWYERNMKIFVNITRLTTSPQDRILVIIGAGHIPLLTHFTEGSRLYHIEPARTYLG